jgi:hypothetical protein
MKIGLVIQGPIITFGQGPNNAVNGFDSRDCIIKNINNFSDKVECIILSTWEGEEVSFVNKISNVDIVTSPLIEGEFKDNRLRQFITTINGIKFAKRYYNLTHIIKIRTDQLIDAEILISWCKLFFEIDTFRNKDKIIFSDKLKNQPFYLGDFIFVGAVNQLIKFCEANIRPYNLHPIIGIDYILKYLELNEINFWKVFNKGAKLHNQVELQIASKYWNYVFSKYFEVMPAQIFEKIIWRGKIMNLIIPNYRLDFEFYNENSQDQNIDKSFVKIRLFHIFLFIIIKIFNKMKSKANFVLGVIDNKMTKYGTNK